VTRLLLLALLAWFLAACQWGRISAWLALAWLWLVRHYVCLCRVGLGRLCGWVEAWVWR
jgi:hypothetical protein